MNKQSFTPGPWKFKLYVDDCDALGSVHDSNGVAVIDTDATCRMADLKFIAHAPDMLDALKAALIELKDPVNKIGAIAAVERAIKMAEGKE